MPEKDLPEYFKVRDSISVILDRIEFKEVKVEDDLVEKTTTENDESSIEDVEVLSNSAINKEPK